MFQVIGMYFICNFGVSGGAHRLWSHKSYKAKLPLRILLLICFSASGQVILISQTILLILRTILLALYIICSLKVQIGVQLRLFSNSVRMYVINFFFVRLQNTICQWVKMHRLHHKYCDTNADPHNTTRGLFFAHFGWVMMKEHPECIDKSKKLDLSDIMSDPVVAFSEKYMLFFLSY